MLFTGKKILFLAKVIALEIKILGWTKVPN